MECALVNRNVIIVLLAAYWPLKESPDYFALGSQLDCLYTLCLPLKTGHLRFVFGLMDVLYCVHETAALG